MKTRIQNQIINQLIKGISLSIISLTAMSANAAGTVGGGGGKGVVCANPDGTVKSVELLDLWESKVLFDLPAIEDNRPVNDLVIEGISRLRGVVTMNISGYSSPDGLFYDEEIFEYQLKQTAEKYFTGKKPKARFLDDVTLTDTEDSFEAVRPSNCQVKNIVNFMANGQVLVANDLYKHMSNTHKAALILHESLYKQLRLFSKEKHSIRTRRAVGYVMNGKSFEANYDHLKTRQVFCKDGNHDTIISFTEGVDETGRKLIYFVPKIINGYLVMGATPTATVDNLNLDQFYDNYIGPKAFPGSTGALMILLDIDSFIEQEYTGSTFANSGDPASRQFRFENRVTGLYFQSNLKCEIVNQRPK
jgi:hypothetical protein